MPVLALVPAYVRPGSVRPPNSYVQPMKSMCSPIASSRVTCASVVDFELAASPDPVPSSKELREICKRCCSFWLVAKRQTADVFGLPRGSIVVPFWGSYTESYKVTPKRNYYWVKLSSRLPPASPMRAKVREGALQS